MQPSEKSELLNSEKPVTQTQQPLPVLPTPSSIKEVPEATANTTIQIKQESSHKIDSSNSEKVGINDTYRLGDNLKNNHVL